MSNEKKHWKRSLVALSLLFLPSSLIFGYETPSPERQRQLIHLVRQDCGSCHGMTFKGGLGPALTPAALHEKSNDVLVLTIIEGRAGTPMPPWSRFLTKDEAGWIVERLKEGFPTE